MAQPLSEDELLQSMAEMIEQGTGMVLEPETIKGLLLEVQREQLKGLVYRAFMAVNQAHEQQGVPVSEPVPVSEEAPTAE